MILTTWTICPFNMTPHLLACLKRNIANGAYLAPPLPEYEDPRLSALKKQIKELEKENQMLKDRILQLTAEYEYMMADPAEDEEALQDTIIGMRLLEEQGEIEISSPSPSVKYVKTKDELELRLQTYLADDTDFAVIVERLNSKILPYIQACKNQQLWEVVRFILCKHSFLVPKLSRSKFAELLVALCPSAGEAKRLVQNMEHYPSTAHRLPKDFDALPSNDKLKIDGTAIEKKLFPTAS